jgi:hypothetical protein
VENDAMSSPNLPSGPTSEDMLNEVEIRLSKVDGTVKASVVNKLRKMIEKDPEQFVKGMRHFLHQGARDEE